jgi:hypothetical protein
MKVTTLMLALITSNETPSLRGANVNHRPSLLIPAISVTLTTSPLGSPFAVIDGIEVIDVDDDVNVVRINVWSDNGQLKLNDKYRSLAHFESCSRRWEFDWRCQGDGVNDRNMTFVAKPSHVGLILADLEYTSFLDKTEDKVTVQVFDGIGGQYISQVEQAYSDGPNGVHYSSVQDGCSGVSGSVEILVSPEQAGGTGGDIDSGGKIHDFFNAQSLLGWLF